MHRRPRPRPKKAPLASCKICWDFSSDLLECRPTNKTKLSELIASAAAGCITCDILRRAIQGLLEVNPPEDFMVGFTVREYEDEDTGEKIRYPELSVWKWVASEPSVGIEMFKIKDDLCPWSFLQKARYSSQKTDSTESFSWACGQIQRCLTDDHHCYSDVEVKLPTRVIDVGKEEDTQVKVIESGGKKGKYIALSHCWGDQVHMTTKLTAHTKNAYEVGIPVDDLPRTFQHAVQYTRKLGISFLWADSLCIIQKDEGRDSKEDAKLSKADWDQESANMCSIYENSYLTLAAASARGCRDGLYFDPTVVELVGETKLGRNYRIYARKAIQHHPSDFPLLNRGWVLQESFLSPRTLFFGQYELFWQCRKLADCQCLGLPSSIDYFPSMIKVPATEQNRQQAQQQNSIERWHQLIGLYSATNLSYQTDKLVAVDGLAQWMARLRNGNCFAGLWDDSFARDLLWRVDTFGRQSGVRTLPEKEGDTTPWSTERWLFPTWSWASVKGHIAWDNESIFANCVTDSWYIKKPENFEDGIPTIMLGELKIRGVLIRVEQLRQVRTVLNKTETFYPDYRFELPGKGHVPEDTPVYCLRVGRWKREYRSLVLICVDEQKLLYERIGVLVFRRQLNGRYTLSDEKIDQCTFDGEEMEGLPPWWETSNLVLDNDDAWVPETSQIITLV